MVSPHSSIHYARISKGILDRMFMRKPVRQTVRFLLAISLASMPVKSQQTNNSSTLTNSAAPSASSVTTGGTNINYQTNNAYQNEVGFGPGVFCRTPTLFVGGNYGENSLDAFDAVTKSGNDASNFSGNIGIVIPFGSSALADCKRLAAITVEDRMISTQLSMIRACAALEREGIRVDPDLYPLLEKCANSVLGRSQASTTTVSPVIQVPAPEVRAKPKVPVTTRS